MYSWYSSNLSLVTGDFDEKRFNDFLWKHCLHGFSCDQFHIHEDKKKQTWKHNIWGSPGYIKITVFRDMTQCISLDGVALAHQIHATLKDSDDRVLK